MVGYHFSGRDLTTLSDNDRTMLAENLSLAIQALGDGWAMHIDASRIETNAYPPHSQWPDPISARIDSERRSMFEQAGAAHDTLYTMTLRWTPPTTLKRGAMRLAFVIGREEESVDRELDACLGAMAEGLAAFEDRLQPHLELVRMGPRSGPHGRPYDSLLTHLRWMLTWEAANLCPRAPTMHLDAQMNCGDLTVGSNPRLGEDHIAIVAIDDLPDATFPNMLAPLQSLPFPSRFHVRWIGFDEEGAKREINAVRVRWKQQTRSWLDKLAHPQPVATSVIDQDAAAMEAEAESQLSTLSSGRVGFGRATWLVEVRNKNLETLQSQARYVRQALQSMGFPARIETTNALEAWLGSLPGHVHENVRAPFVDTRTLSNMLPLTSTWMGPAVCPSPLIDDGNAPPLVVCRTEGTTPFRLSLHVGDVGHSLLFGATGSGKSTLLGLLCAQWLRYKDAKVVIIDKDRSLETLTRAVGGIHHSIDPDAESASFAPFAKLESPSERAWAAEWIADLCAVQKVQLSRSDLTQIQVAISDCANSPGKRTVGDIAVTVQVESVKDAMDHYATGVYCKIFNGEKDAIGNGERWLCVELAGVMSEGEKLQLPALSYLFRLVERQATGEPLLLVIDEAWAALGHEVFRERLREWLKTLRKKNVAVLLATQSLSDVGRSGILDVIAESCPTRIYGANSEAGLSADAYASLKVPEGLVERIAQFRPKREYLITQRDRGARVVDFSLGPETLAFVGVSATEDLNQLKALQEAHPDNWTDQWLEERVHGNGN